MFNRESILKSLNTENYYIDKHSLDLFLEDWKIESIYEDEDGLEFYDDLALEKIKKGISLKAQGYSDEQIITKLSRMEAKVEKTPEPAQPVQPIMVSDLLNQQNCTIEENPSTEVVVQEEKAPEVIPQGKSFTLDVSSQTLQTSRGTTSYLIWYSVLQQQLSYRDLWLREPSSYHTVYIQQLFQLSYIRSKHTGPGVVAG